MADLDLTPFGFTPTESKVYQVLLSGGPGTGYAVARSAGLARANAYGALEGLVAKGAARADEGQPKVFRAEPPTSVLASITNTQGEALEQLSRALDGFGAPTTPRVVELTSPKGLLQFLSHEIGRAERTVLLLAPPEAYPLLTPVLRRAAGAGLQLALASQAPVHLPFATVQEVAHDPAWPGLPVIAVIDDRSAVIAARRGTEVEGHWSGAPAFVAAARHTFERLRTPL
jgi:sugar-specific transcriptional regulator TrmB